MKSTTFHYLILGLTLTLQFSMRMMAQNPASPAEHIWSKKTPDGWEVVGREMYTYDGQNRLTKVIATSPENDDRKIKTIQFLSDSVLMEIDSEYVAGIWNIFHDSIVMQHNDIELFYKLTQPEPSNAGWIPSLKRIITKDENQNIIKETYERYREGKWEQEDRMLYHFKNDLCREEFFQVREEDDWITRQKSLHQYDNGGKEISSEVYYQNKDAQLPEVMMSKPGLRILYAYNKDGSLSERISQKQIDGKWEDEFKRTCLY